jgi:precorrin-6x reductase
MVSTIDSEERFELPRRTLQGSIALHANLGEPFAASLTTERSAAARQGGLYYILFARSCAAEAVHRLRSVDQLRHRIEAVSDTNAPVIIS